MKKLLAILSSIGLVATASSSVVSCSLFGSGDSSSKESDADKAKEEAEIKALENQIADKKAELQKLQQQYDTLNNQLNDLLSELTSDTAEYESMNGQIKDLNNQLNVAQTKINNLNSSIAELQGKIDSNNSTRIQNEERIKNLNNSIENANKETIKARSKLIHELGGETATIDSLDQILKDIEITNGQIAKAKEDQISLQNELDSINSEIENGTKTINELNTQKEALTKTRDEMSKSNSDNQQAIDNLNSQIGEIDKSIASETEYQNNLNKTKDQLNEQLQTKSEELKDANDKLNALTKDKVTESGKIDQLSDDIKQKSTEYQKDIETEQSYSEELSQLNEQNDNMQKESELINEQIDHQRMLLENANDELDYAKLNVEFAQKNLDKIERELAAENYEIGSIKKNIDNLNKQKSQTNEEIAHLQDKINKIKNIIDDKVPVSKTFDYEVFLDNNSDNPSTPYRDQKKSNIMAKVSANTPDALAAWKSLLYMENRSMPSGEAFSPFEAFFDPDGDESNLELKETAQSSSAMFNRGNPIIFSGWDKSLSWNDNISKIFQTPKSVSATGGWETLDGDDWTQDTLADYQKSTGMKMIKILSIDPSDPTNEEHQQKTKIALTPSLFKAVSANPLIKKTDDGFFIDDSPSPDEPGELVKAIMGADGRGNKSVDGLTVSFTANVPVQDTLNNHQHGDDYDLVFDNNGASDSFNKVYAGARLHLHTEDEAGKVLKAIFDDSKVYIDPSFEPSYSGSAELTIDNKILGKISLVIGGLGSEVPFNAYDSNKYPNSFYIEPFKYDGWDGNLSDFDPSKIKPLTNEVKEYLKKLGLVETKIFNLFPAYAATPFESWNGTPCGFSFDK